MDTTKEIGPTYINKRSQSSTFVTDQLNDVENSHDNHLLMIYVEALWTLTAGNIYTGEVFNFKYRRRVTGIRGPNCIFYVFNVCRSICTTFMHIHYISHNTYTCKETIKST